MSGALICTDAAPVVSCHNSPQPSPQMLDCGCVTAVHVTDRDFLRDERPFEMRLVTPCGTETCETAALINRPSCHRHPVHFDDCWRCEDAALHAQAER
jgi:hypothetical protein